MTEHEKFIFPSFVFQAACKIQEMNRSGVVKDQFNFYDLPSLGNFRRFVGLTKEPDGSTKLQLMIRGEFVPYLAFTPPKSAHSNKDTEQPITLTMQDTASPSAKVLTTEPVHSTPISHYPLSWSNPFFNRESPNPVLDNPLLHVIVNDMCHDVDQQPEKFLQRFCEYEFDERCFIDKEYINRPMTPEEKNALISLVVETAFHIQQNNASDVPGDVPPDNPLPKRLIVHNLALGSVIGYTIFSLLKNPSAGFLLLNKLLSEESAPHDQDDSYASLTKREVVTSILFAIQAAHQIQLMYANDLKQCSFTYYEKKNWLQQVILRYVDNNVVTMDLKIGDELLPYMQLTQPLNPPAFEPWKNAGIRNSTADPLSSTRRQRNRLPPYSVNFPMPLKDLGPILDNPLLYMTAAQAIGYLYYHPNEGLKLLSGYLNETLYLADNKGIHRHMTATEKKEFTFFVIQTYTAMRQLDANNGNQIKFTFRETLNTSEITLVKNKANNSIRIDQTRGNQYRSLLTISRPVQNHLPTMQDRASLSSSGTPLASSGEYRWVDTLVSSK